MIGTLLRRLLGHDEDPQPVIHIRRFLADEDGHLEADLEAAPEVLANLYAHLSLMLSKAENYVETSLTIKPAGEVEPYIVTVQRGLSPTPHELRQRAEHEAEQLRDLLEVWLTGDCPMYDERCRSEYLCWHCYENAVVDFDLEDVGTP